MKEGLKRLKSGKFNDMSQERMPDGSTKVTLTSRKDGRIWEFTVKDLYGKNEKVLKHEEKELKDGRPEG